MKTNRLTLFILLSLSVFIYLLGFLFSYDYLISDLYTPQNRLGAIRSLLEYGLMYISFIVFASYLWKFKYLKWVSIITLFILAINSFISYCCYFIYDSGFNIGMAVSVLDSNISEAVNMVTSYIIPLVLVFTFFVINIILIANLSKLNFNRITKFSAFLWLLLPILFYMKNNFIGAKGGSPMVKNIFYHMKDFKGAYDLHDRMNGIKNNNIKYTYIQNQDGIETIVVLVGESGRKQNMSLYGYDRDTTPNQLKEKNNMLIFKNANSPAGITNLSLPLTLSKIAPDNFDNDLKNIADNIVNLANNYGYYTSWLTTQNNIKGVTEIASFANEKKWVNGYDMELFPVFKESLKIKGKKLIILHINGSHPNPCLRFPDEESFFKEGNDLDCYDNSVRYTDKLIGNILKELRGDNTAFIYFTDHGLKIKDSKIIHTDSKESSSVPFYIWFGNDNKTIDFDKSLDNNISISYLYPIIMKLIGLNEEKIDKIEKNKYLKLDHSVIEYNLLNE